MNPRSFIFLVLAIDLLVSIIAFILGKCLPKDIIITIISAIQLLATSSIAWKIYKTRSSQNHPFTPSHRHPINFSYFVWALIAAGFLFLTIDEIIEIHEGIDKIIHKIFQIKETGFTDRIDDLIIGVYGIIGIGVLLFYKNELVKYKEVFPLLISGFILVFLSVGFDALTNRSDIILSLIEKRKIAWTIFEKLRIVEDSCQIFAEGVILSTFYWCLQIAKANKQSQNAIQ